MGYVLWYSSSTYTFVFCFFLENNTIFERMTSSWWVDVPPSIGQLMTPLPLKLMDPPSLSVDGSPPQLVGWPTPYPVGRLMDTLSWSVDAPPPPQLVSWWTPSVGPLMHLPLSWSVDAPPVNRLMDPPPVGRLMDHPPPPVGRLMDPPLQLVGWWTPPPVGRLMDPPSSRSVYWPPFPQLVGWWTSPPPSWSVDGPPPPF